MFRDDEAKRSGENSIKCPCNAFGHHEPLRRASMIIGIEFPSLCNSVGGMNAILPKDIPRYYHTDDGVFHHRIKVITRNINVLTSLPSMGLSGSIPCKESASHNVTELLVASL